VINLGQPGRVETYEPFFGLNESPFSLAPDTRFLFASASHSAALEQITYALERREPLVVVTGEIGTGKTLLCRTVLQQLRRKTFLSVIADPLLERNDLLKQLLEDFGVVSKDRTKLADTTRHDLIQALHAFLRSLVPIHAHAVVIVDEAQHLKPDVLEEIRLLSNVDDERGTLLQIILVGQTDLEAVLARPELRQLQQRVSRRLRLEPLTNGEVQQYITHRLALARDGNVTSPLPGATDLARELAELIGTNPGVEFTPGAIGAITHFSGGLPRVINLLCDRALEGAFAARVRVVDAPLIDASARALGLGEPRAPAVEAEPITTAPAAPTVSAPNDGEATVRRADADAHGSFWTVMRADSDAAGTAAEQPDEVASIGDAPPLGSAARSGVTRYVVLAASLVVAAAALWFGVRSARPPTGQNPPAVTSPAAATPAVATPAVATPSVATPAVTAPVAPTTGSPNIARDTPRPGTIAPAPNNAPPARAPTPPAAAAPVPSPIAATPASGRFDIVVASFRTDARATSVAAAVTALGLPMRRRVSDGWQQVISGPFASRPEADRAQQQLNRAGLAGTQIVPAVR
jgi:general secretion pathway protein A